MVRAVDMVRAAAVVTRHRVDLMCALADTIPTSARLDRATGIVTSAASYFFAPCTGPKFGITVCSHLATAAGSNIAAERPIPPP